MWGRMYVGGCMSVRVCLCTILVCNCVFRSTCVYVWCLLGHVCVWGVCLSVESYVCMRVFICVYASESMYFCLYVCMYVIVYFYVCSCEYACMDVYVIVCMCVGMKACA